MQSFKINAYMHRGKGESEKNENTYHDREH